MRKALDDQITRQKSEIEILGEKLKAKIQEAVQEKIKSQLHDIVKASIAEKVEEKVRNEVECFKFPTNFKNSHISLHCLSSLFKYPKIYVSKLSNTDGKSWKSRQPFIIREHFLTINISEF